MNQIDELTREAVQEMWKSGAERDEIVEGLMEADYSEAEAVAIFNDVIRDRYARTVVIS